MREHLKPPKCQVSMCAWVLEWLSESIWHGPIYGHLHITGSAHAHLVTHMPWCICRIIRAKCMWRNALAKCSCRSCQMFDHVTMSDHNCFGLYRRKHDEALRRANAIMLPPHLAPLGLAPFFYCSFGYFVTAFPSPLIKMEESASFIATLEVLLIAFKL